MVSEVLMGSSITHIPPSHYSDGDEPPGFVAVPVTEVAQLVLPGERERERETHRKGLHE